MKVRFLLLVLALIAQVACKGEPAPASGAPTPVGGGAPAIDPTPLPEPEPEPVCTPIDGHPDPTVSGGEITLNWSDTTTLTASGGTGPYTWSIASGFAQINPTTGEFTANASGETVVRATDQFCRSATTKMTVISGGATRTPNDSDYSLQNSAYTKVSAVSAWGIVTDCSAITVAVIDTGVDLTHPDLTPNLVAGYNFVSDNANPHDDHYHGTHVAGSLGAVANNANGVAGACWKVKIMPLKFMDSAGSGFISDAVDAVNYARANGVQIMNNSWGGGGYNQSLKDAIDNAAREGIVFVAAAGNSSLNLDTTRSYPASYESYNMVSVAATDSLDRIASFSNYGATRVHLAAPGTAIYSTLPTYTTSAMSAGGIPTSYGSLNGTSMAAPMVSGVLASMKASRSDLTLSQLRSRLFGSTDKPSVLNSKVLHGRVNFHRAVDPGAP